MHVCAYVCIFVQISCRFLCLEIYYLIMIRDVLVLILRVSVTAFILLLIGLGMNAGQLQGTNKAKLPKTQSHTIKYSHMHIKLRSSLDKTAVQVTSKVSADLKMSYGMCLI